MLGPESVTHPTLGVLQPSLSLTDFAVWMFVVSHVIGWHDWRKMILAVPQASGSLFSTSWSMYSLWRRLVRISSRLFQGRLTGIPESVLLASIVSHDISKKKKGPMYAMGEGWRDKLISLPGGVLACQTMSWLLWPELGGTGSYFSPALALPRAGRQKPYPWCWVLGLRMSLASESLDPVCLFGL